MGTKSASVIEDLS